MGCLTLSIETRGLTAGTVKDKTLEAGNPDRSFAGIAAYLDGIKSGVYSGTVNVKVSGELTDDVITAGYYTQAEVEAYGLTITDKDTITVIDTAAVAAAKTFQKLTYTAKLAGVLGNNIDIVYVADGVAGGETVVVTGNSTNFVITVHIGLVGAKSTSNLIKTAIINSLDASALVTVTGGDDVADQVAVASPNKLINGAAEVNHIEYYLYNNNPISFTFDHK